jgi:hypothetical protein
MKRTICVQEVATSRAARMGQWEGSLWAHVAGCAVCRDIVLTARGMQVLAKRLEDNVTLPHASLVWWKSQFLQKRAKAEWAQRPLEVVEFAYEAMVPLGLAGWLTWNWSVVQRVWMELLMGVLPQISKAAWSVAHSALIFSR